MTSKDHPQVEPALRKKKEKDIKMQPEEAAVKIKPTSWASKRQKEDQNHHCWKQILRLKSRTYEKRAEYDYISIIPCNSPAITSNGVGSFGHSLCFIQ